jgi:membrane fusion protein
MATITSSLSQRTDVEAQIQVQQQIVQTLRNTLDRYSSIAAKGFISQTQINQQEQQLLTSQEELIRLRQQLKTLEEQDRKAQAELAQSRADETNQSAGALSSADNFRAQQAQIRAEQSYVLLAPEDGVVTAIQTGAGRSIDPTVPLMTVVPADAKLHAELYAPSRAIGFIRSGEEVRLLYDAFPYERFGSFKGRVASIAKVALDPNQIDAPFKFEEPMYRINVALHRQDVVAYGNAVPLQPGMTLSANIILERRTFLDWLLEPLRAVRNRDH